MSDELGAEALRRLHDLMRRVHAAHDPFEVLQEVAEGVVRACGFGVAGISYLRGDDMLEMTAVAGNDDARDQLLGVLRPRAELEREFALAETWGMLRFVPADRVATLPQSGWIPDTSPTADADAWLPEDTLFAPLLSPLGALLGVLSVDLPEDGRRPDPQRRELLEMYAVQAGTALFSARERERLREDLRLASVVRRINEILGRRLDLGHVIDTAVEPLASGMRCTAAWLRTLDGQGEVHGRGRGAGYPSSRELVPPGHIVDSAQAVAQSCWEQDRMAIIGPDYPDPTMDETANRKVFEFVARAGADTVAVVPFGFGGECLGYFVLARQTNGGQAWTGAEQEAAHQIARDLGRGVHNARLYERERDLARNLGELNREKSELLRTICHELKNPLTSIAGHLELCETLLQREAGRSHDAINRNLTRVNDLIADLLLLAKVADPHLPLTRQQVNIGGLVSAALDPLRVEAERRDIRLTVQHMPSDPERAAQVWGDARELERALGNIVSNAIKYSPDSSEVCLRIASDQDAVTFSCRDHGLGISTADQQRLGDEFFRSTNREALARPGTGLGLSIVKNIVMRHGGTLHIDSAPGRGSTFTIAFPDAGEAVNVTGRVTRTTR